MGATLVLIPVIITTWPMLAASVAAAAAAAGFTSVEEKPKEVKKLRSADIKLENMETVADSLSHDDQIVIQRGNITVTFSRDARGQFKAHVDGDLPHEELQKIGEEIAGKVVQQYVYRRLTSELQNQGFITLEEDKGPEESIRLYVRRHED